MLKRMLVADLRRSAVVSITLTALIALAAALVAMSASLIVTTTIATDRLWADAKPPDVVQMHTGPIDSAAIDTWVGARGDIVDHHVLRTLPVPGRALWINGTNQAASVLEPAFVVSPERFDLLLGQSGTPAAPGPGQVALPVHYLAEGGVAIGDNIRVDINGWQRELMVVDFVRDAQMNPSMVTSKRLVVHPSDFAELDAHLGDAEYLIEFRIANPSQAKVVLDAYAASGLPSNGIAIDSSIFKLMNGLTTMLVAAVALLIAALLVVIGALALRYAFLTAVEADLAEISVLKAIGSPPRTIKRLYLLKYLTLAAAGAVLGYLLSLPMAAQLGAPVLLYLGRPAPSVSTIMAPIGAALAVGLAIVGFCVLLRRVDKISALEALRTGSSGQLRTRRHRWRLSRSRWLPAQQWLGAREALRANNALLMAVLAVATFIMIVPVNVITTVEDPRFATYLGVGQSDLRVDVRDAGSDFEQIRRRIGTETAGTRTKGSGAGRLVCGA